MIGYLRLATNASAILAARLFAILLGVVLATVLVERLGAERYGIWSLLTLISGYSTLIDFGLSSAVERRVASLTAQGLTGQLFASMATALWLIVAVTSIAQFAVIAFLALSPGAMFGSELRAALLVLPVCTGLSLASLALGAALAGQQRLGRLHLWRSIGLAVGTGAVIVAVAAGVNSLNRLLLLYTSGSLVTLVLVWSSLRLSLRPSVGPRAFDADAMRELLGYGGILQGATMVPPVAEYLFRLVLAGRFGVEFAAVYDLGARAAMVPRSLAGALFSAMTPFAVHLERQAGLDGVARLVRTTSRHVALFILPATAVLLAFAEPLISFWIGAADPSLVASVRRCFQIVLVAHALGTIAVPAAMVARALGRPHAEAVVATISFLTALVTAQVVSSWEVAVALLWGLPAIGGYVVWYYVARSLPGVYLSARDSIGALLVGGGTFAGALLLAGWDQGPALLRLGVASLLALLLAILVERMHPDGWRSARAAADTP